MILLQKSGGNVRFFAGEFSLFVSTYVLCVCRGIVWLSLTAFVVPRVLLHLDWFCLLAKLAILYFVCFISSKFCKFWQVFHHKDDGRYRLLSGLSVCSVEWSFWLNCFHTSYMFLYCGQPGWPEMFCQVFSQTTILTSLFFFKVGFFFVCGAYSVWFHFWSNFFV